MSLHFVIDGYNLIKQARIPNRINGLAPLAINPEQGLRVNLEDSRAALIRFLKIYRPQGSKGNQVTVVFDGKENNYPAGQISGAIYQYSGIRVIFSQGECADDKIKELVQHSKNPKNIVVVTNDREIRDFVKQLKAQVKTIEEFLVKFNSSKTKEIPDAKIILSPVETARITEEMKKIWLK